MVLFWFGGFVCLEVVGWCFVCLFDLVFSLGVFGEAEGVYFFTDFTRLLFHFLHIRMEVTKNLQATILTDC